MKKLSSSIVEHLKRTLPPFPHFSDPYSIFFRLKFEEIKELFIEEILFHYY